MIRSLYRGDCLNVLEDYIEPESVDLVYLDPPFNSKSTYNLPFKDKDKTHKAVAAFKDTWTWQDTPDESGLSDNDRLEELHNHLTLRDIASLVDIARKHDTPQNSMGSYILSMTYRLQAIYKVLKPTGSVYLHCDPTANYFLRMIMDCVFGRSNYRNEIVWGYKWGGTSKKYFARKHQTIFWYSKTQDWIFNIDEVREPYTTTDPRWHNNEKGKVIRDLWDDIPTINTEAKERLGYPTQKPLTLLERIIRRVVILMM